MISRHAATMLLLSLITKIQNGGQHNIKQSNDSDTPLFQKESSLTRIPDFCVAIFYREDRKNPSVLKNGKIKLI